MVLACAGDVGGTGTGNRVVQIEKLTCKIPPKYAEDDKDA